MTCKARQYSDQMLCDNCGLQWDVNDPDSPCPNTLEKIRGLLNATTRIPKNTRRSNYRRSLQGK